MKPFRSLTILLLLIVLLPVLFFSAYEITRINKNEKELLIIYNKQLEAILFSINLYSEDIVNSWATKINANLLSNDTSSQSRFLRETPQLLSIAISPGNGSAIRIINASAKEDTSLIKRIEKIIADSSRKIQRLALITVEDTGK
ncbi:MAG: hypothetical protein HC830_01190 [Bacteroidetes bacterium]|nr:hypothetical protein [Bacteroidota bacterium]